MGCRSKLTPELQEFIVSQIENGVPIRAVAAAARINHTTFYNWLKLGREGRPRYKSFAEAVDAAIAKSEAILIQRIHDASKQTWQAAAWLLERRFPERWGRRDRINATITTQVARLDADARAAALNDPDVQRAIDIAIEKIAALTSGDEVEDAVEGEVIDYE